MWGKGKAQIKRGTNGKRPKTRSSEVFGGFLERKAEERA